MTRYTPEEAALLALAAHEVAHAVACRAAARTRAGRLTVLRAVLQGDRGYVDHSDVDLDNQDQVNTELVVILAGREGGARWAQRNAGMWRGQAMRWSARSCSTDLADFRRLKQHSDRSPGWLENRARSVVASNWSRIDRLAHKLAAAGRLSGSHFN